MVVLTRKVMERDGDCSGDREGGIQKRGQRRPMETETQMG
jgi:hypothetical protein